jgi:hypothetical protein
MVDLALVLFNDGANAAFAVRAMNLFPADQIFKILGWLDWLGFSDYRHRSVDLR